MPLEAKICPKCGKNFERPSWLKKHLERKTPCEPILGNAESVVAADAAQNRCKYCNRQFASANSMYRHVRQYCKIAKSDDGASKMLDFALKKQLEAQGAQLESQNMRLEAQSAKLEQQHEQITELMTLLKERLSVVPIGLPAPTPSTTQVGAQQAETIYNQQGGTMTNNTTHVTLNIFGQEATDYITAADIQRLAADPEVAERPALLAARVCDLIFSHREHPENRTAYIPNKKEPYVLVYTGETPKPWQVHPIPQILRKMVRRSGEELSSKVNIYDVQILQDMKAEIGTISQARTDATYNVDQLAIDLKPELSAILLNNKPDREPLH